MKKKICLYLGCFLLLIIGAGCVFLSIRKSADVNEAPKKGMLFVNNKEITNDNVIVLSKYAKLPFIEVLIGFGANVEWLDNNTANITYKDKRYTLNLKDTLLVEEENNFNLLTPPPGSTTYYCKAMDRELIIDSNTIRTIMYLMGEKIDINIDHDKQIVYATERKE